MCEIRRRQEVGDASLGMFRPADIALRIDPDEDNVEGQAFDQPSLFFPNKSRLEKIPYKFRYDYRCSDTRCNGHTQSNVDWEIAAAFRDWRVKYGEAETLERIHAKWVDEMFAEDRESRLFVGNMHQHPGQFLVLGVYWPKRC